MIDTPIAGLVKLALRDPTLGDIARRATARPPELSLAGPAGARPFVASALAQNGPLLVVTATGREADELTAELKGVFGDAAALLPSWETLPHERLSPGVDTVGARLMVLRRLASPDDERLGPPLRVVVTTVRSLLQPMAPDVLHIHGPQIGGWQPGAASSGEAGMTVRWHGSGVRPHASGGRGASLFSRLARFAWSGATS